jgi:hypothetical protein
MLDAADLATGHASIPAGDSRELAVTELLVLGAAALLCVAHVPIFVLASSTPRLAILAMLAVAGAFSLVRLSGARDQSGIAASTLASWIVIAALLSGAPFVAMKGMYGRELSGLIVIGALCVWALGRTASTRTVQLLPAVVAIGLAFNALIGIAQVVARVDTGFLQLQDGRAAGLTSHPVYFGALMAGAAAMLAAVRNVPYWVRMAGVGVTALACNLSGSRVATAAGLFGLVCYVLKRRDERFARRAAFPFTFAIGVLGGSLVASIVGGSGSTGVSRVASTGEGGRFDVWRYGVAALVERPFAGWGFGRFRTATQGHYSAAFVRDYAGYDVRQAWFDGHNLFVTTAVAIGVVGLAFAIWFGVSASVIARGPLGYFVLPLALTWLVEPAGLATLPLGLLALGAAAHRMDDVPVMRPSPHRRWVAAAAGTFGVILAASILVGDARLKRALDSEDPEQIDSAARMFADDSVVADLVGQAWFIAEEHDPSLRPKVLDWSRRAIAHEPDRPYLWSRLAARQVTFGDLDGAEESVNRALALQPWHMQAWQIRYLIAQRSHDALLLEQSSEALCALGLDLDACGPEGQ